MMILGIKLVLYSLISNISYRLLHRYKKLVRNRAYPEGSIAEGYLVDECMVFCSMYLHGVDTWFSRVSRNFEGDVDDTILSGHGRAFGTGKVDKLDQKSLAQAHHYVLTNCEDVMPYVT